MRGVTVGKPSPQQSAVYRAEYKCGNGERLASIEQAQHYVYKVMSSSWWHERNYSRVIGNRGIEVQEIPDGVWSAADPDQAVIGLTKGGLNEATVLHEVAHCICGQSVGHEGPFVRILLELTYLVRGPAAYTELYAALEEEGASVG